MEILKSSGLVALAAMAVAACSPSGGADAKRKASSAFSTPPPASNLQERADRGLAISPVPIDTTGLSDEDRMKVGIGSYIVNAATVCAGCHSSPAGFLAGGNPFSLGGDQVVFSRNLTPDPKTGMKLTEWQFLDTLRTGHDRQGAGDKMLIVMPWMFFRWMSEADIYAIYAYLRLIPPVDNAVPPDAKDKIPAPPSVPFPGAYTDGEKDGPLFYNGDYFPPLRGLAITPRLLEGVTLPPAGMTASTGLTAQEHATLGTGAYIANAMAICSECHTNPARTPDQSKINTAAFLTGGTVYTVPPPLQPVFKQVRAMSANLKGETHGFFNEPDDSYGRFHDLIVSGTHADETPVRPLGFPMILVAGNLKHLLDDDLHAVYDYVKAVPNVTGANDQERQPWAALCSADADCGAGQTCATETHECVGKACTADVECAACQTCGGGKCQAPAKDSACLAASQ